MGKDRHGPYILVYTGDGKEHWTFRLMSSLDGNVPVSIYYNSAGSEVRRWTAS